MRIAYCANVRLPSERAHGHQIAQVCDALAALGHDVTILAPKRWNPVKEEYHAYYKANPKVRLQYLRAFDPNMHGMSTGLPGLLFANYTTGCAVRCTLQKQRFDLLYTRAPALLGKLLQTGVPVILELHQIPRFGHRRFVAHCNRCRVVACLTSPMRDALIHMGVASERVIVEGDAVQLSAFMQESDVHETRRVYALPSDMPVIGYAGQLASMGLSKGVEVLLEAARILLERGSPMHVAIAGGPDSVRTAMFGSLSQEMQKRVHFAGVIQRDAIPAFLQMCDVLVYPAPRSNHSFYMRDTSPLKLFEYMAARRSIVCADIPPVHDVVDARCVAFFAPGDAAGLAASIEHVLSDTNAIARVEQSYRCVQEHTWEKRMGRIIAARPR